MKTLPLVAIIAGIVLLLLSVAWPKTVDKDLLWSPEEHAELADAVRAAHDSQHDHDHGAADHDHQGEPDEYTMSRERVAQSIAKLEQARNGRRNLVARLKWAGIVCIAVGAIGFYVAKNAEE